MARTFIKSNELNDTIFHPTTTNNKLGKILGVATYPGSKELYFKNGIQVTDMIGTCHNVCTNGCEGSCYAIGTVKQYEQACINRIENTLFKRRDMDSFFNAIYFATKKGGYKMIRYTESGEIEDYNEFMHVVELARKLPNVTVYLYTKNYKVLRQYFENNVLPENMTVLVSVWESYGVKELNEFIKYDNVKGFIVNNDDIKTQATCPAYKQVTTKTGKIKTVMVKVLKLVNGKYKKVTPDSAQCASCGLCTTKHKSIKLIKCYEH